MSQSVPGHKMNEKTSAHALLAFIPQGPLSDFDSYHPRQLFRDKRQLEKELEALAKVTSSHELREHLKWRVSNGIRREFNTIRQDLELLTTTERTQRIAAETSEPLRSKLAVAESYLWRLTGGVAAFDASFIVYFSKAGERLGWLAKEEASAIIEQAIKLARRQYNNWFDYCAGFIAGMEFQGSPHPADKNEREHRLRRLLSMSGSPLKEAFFLGAYQRNGRP
ncbi:DUF1266 domain-containing protein [Gorillibacterium timonense]|uniref:DUF1266 domain-containing protein n=1 Tax=Gorillibacterium timonense TaxID=1689269 RepID=UPI00071DCF21|nr:DUF1266 domain-containing protein [Gorillibacterium timonense]